MTAVDDHVVPGPNSRDHRIDARRIDHLHRAHRGLVAFHDEDHLAPRALNDAGLRHDDRILHGLNRELHADERARPQLFVLVVELGLDFHRAGVRIDRVVDERELAGQAAAAFGQHRRHIAAAGTQRLQGVLQVALRQVE